MLLRCITHGHDWDVVDVWTIYEDIYGHMTQEFYNVCQHCGRETVTREESCNGQKF